MKIYNIKEIFDNGDYVTIITNSDQEIHLPKGKHSIVLITDASTCLVSVSISFNQG